MALIVKGEFWLASPQRQRKPRGRSARNQLQTRKRYYNIGRSTISPVFSVSSRQHAVFGTCPRNRCTTRSLGAGPGAGSIAGGRDAAHVRHVSHLFIILSTDVRHAVPLLEYGAETRISSRTAVPRPSFNPQLAVCRLQSSASATPVRFPRCFSIRNLQSTLRNSQDPFLTRTVLMVSNVMTQSSKTDMCFM